jgi:hypothetical protein
VPGPMLLDEVLAVMRRYRAQMAVVMDQHGGTATSRKARAGCRSSGKAPHASGPAAPCGSRRPDRRSNAASSIRK